MAIPLAVMAVVGTAISAYGAIQQGKAANASAQYNAAVTEQDRRRALQTASIAAEDKSRENNRRLSTLRASMGSSGFELAGSPLAVLSDTSTEMSLDVRRTQDQGDVQSRSMYVQEQGDLAAGANAQRAGYLSAAGTFLSGSASAGSTYQRASSYA